MGDKKLLDDGAEKPEKREKTKFEVAAEEIQRLMKNFVLVKQSLTYEAMITRAKYDALVSQGFTKEQALELCKK